MTAEDVKAIPVAQKLWIMEILWEDLRDHLGQSQLTPPLKELLDRRRDRGRSGIAQVFDWDKVKSGIGGA
jgi:hypothetical protein